MTDRAAGSSSALVTDLYELNMAASYLRHGMHDRATFSLFIRRLPPTRGLEDLTLISESGFSDSLRLMGGRKMWTLKRAAVLACVAALTLAGCGRGDDPEESTASSGSGDTEEQTTEDPIRLGMITSLTGNVASVGQDCLDGAELAVERLNEAGGLLGRQVELVSADDTSLPDVGVEEFRRMAESGVDAMIAPASSAIALAVTGISEEFELPMFSCSSSTAALTVQEFQPYYFSLVPNSIMSAHAEVIAMGALGADRYSILAADYEGGHSKADSFKSTITEVNPDATIGAELFPPLGETDFTSYINALLSDEAPAVYSVLFGADLIAFTKQAIAVDFFDTRTLGALYDSAVLKALGDEAPVGAVGFEFAPWFALEEGDAESFVDAFRGAYDHEPSSWSTLAYDAVSVWAAAVESAGDVDSAAVVEALETEEFTTMRGPVTFRAEDHQAPVGQFYGRVAEVDPELGYAIYDDVVYIAGDEILPSVEAVLEMRG